MILLLPLASCLLPLAFSPLFPVPYSLSFASSLLPAAYCLPYKSKDQKEHRRLAVFRLGALTGSLLTQW